MKKEYGARLGDKLFYVDYTNPIWLHPPDPLKIENEIILYYHESKS